MVGHRLLEGWECVTNIALQLQFRAKMFRSGFQRLVVRFVIGAGRAEFRQALPRLLPQQAQPRKLPHNRIHFRVPGDADIDSVICHRPAGSSGAGVGRGHPRIPAGWRPHTQYRRPFAGHGTGAAPPRRKTGRHQADASETPAPWSALRPNRRVGLTSICCAILVASCLASSLVRFYAMKQVLTGVTGIGPKVILRPLDRFPVRAFRELPCII